MIRGNRLSVPHSHLVTEDLLSLLLKTLRGAEWAVAFPELGSSETVRATLIRDVNTLICVKKLRRVEGRRTGKLGVRKKHEVIIFLHPVSPAINLVCKALQVRRGKVWSPSRTEKEDQSVGENLVYVDVLALLVQKDKYYVQKDEKRLSPEPLSRSSSVRTQWCLWKSFIGQDRFPRIATE